jgi:hypothetical protein
VRIPEGQGSSFVSAALGEEATQESWAGGRVTVQTAERGAAEWAGNSLRGFGVAVCWCAAIPVTSVGTIVSEMEV